MNSTFFAEMQTKKKQFYMNHKFTFSNQSNFILNHCITEYINVISIFLNKKSFVIKQDPNNDSFIFLFFFLFSNFFCFLVVSYFEWIYIKSFCFVFDFIRSFFLFFYIVSSLVIISLYFYIHSLCWRSTQ